MSKKVNWDKLCKDDGTVRYRSLKKLWNIRNELSDEDLHLLTRFTFITASSFSDRIERMQKKERNMFQAYGRLEELWRIKQKK